MSTATATEPWFVVDARARKAAKIANHLTVLGFTAADVMEFTDEDRADTERGADIARKGSPTTWRLVIGMLAGSTAADALCPTCGIGDPEGEPGPRKPFNHPGRCSR